MYATILMHTGWVPVEHEAWGIAWVHGDHPGKFFNLTYAWKVQLQENSKHINAVWTAGATDGNS